jgi:bifunctional non-homologous end joining protein LigD
MPEVVRPMLCTLVAKPFDHPAWIFEPKFDGLRILGRFDGRELTVLSNYPKTHRKLNLGFSEKADYYSS